MIEISKKHIIAGLFVLFIFFLVYLKGIWVDIPRFEAMLPVMEEELDKISAHPYSREIKRRYWVDIDEASISRRFITNLNYDEIIDYYDNEIPKHGWQYIGEKDLTEAGVGHIGYTRIYKKEKYCLTLYYYTTSQNGYSVSLYLHYGGGQSC